ncbi:trypsin-1-like [Copidosoma floridanum]|uniref:trypsin-1-like n=1 Tax=Copidosoma floridanum TaxID=29053 RepID=UPI000C6F6A26|nr:trypsin-1-like [Copidosoma floridanum]
MVKFILFVLALVAVTQGRVVNNLTSRIVNGTSAKLGELPFQASLQRGGRAYCGGSVINEYYVVTAAHCLARKQASSLTVIVGTINWQKPGYVHQVEKIIVHSKFTSKGSFENDIGLVEVKTPFQFSFILQPVLLPTLDEEVATNSIAIVSGWGRLGGKVLKQPDNLQKAEIFIIEPESCQSVMTEIIHPTQLCANDPTARRGQCSGDSGGPLSIDGKLVGIVSWSIKDPYCASTTYPGIYTRVSKYVDWINENAVHPD